MAFPGGYDPLLGVTSPYPITQQPQTTEKFTSPEADDGVFIKNLAEQLQRSSSPYAAAGLTPAAIETQISDIPVEKLKEIDSVSREFESVLLFTMFKQMWATIPDSTLFGSGLSKEIYRDMWLEELSGEIASSGNGLGVADNFKWEMIQRELQSTPPDSVLDLLT